VTESLTIMSWLEAEKMQKLVKNPNRKASYKCGGVWELMLWHLMWAASICEVNLCSFCFWCNLQQAESQNK
jgi:hypothetical protein